MRTSHHKRSKLNKSACPYANSYLIDAVHGDIALVLLVGSGLAVEEGLAVLVELDLSDLNLGRMDGDRHGGAVGLVAGEALDVDAILLANNSDDLALTAVTGATGDADFILTADGDGTDAVLLTKLLGEPILRQIWTSKR